MSDEGQNYNQRNQVQIDLVEYEEKNAQIGALKDEIQKMKDAAGPNKMGWMWLAPEDFSRWRIFPRAFITMYIYLLFQSANWFMGLEDPTVAQSGLISVLVTKSNNCLSNTLIAVYNIICSSYCFGKLSTLALVLVKSLIL